MQLRRFARGCSEHPGIARRGARSFNCSSVLHRGAAASPQQEENEEVVDLVVVGGGRMGEIRCGHINANPRANLAGFVDAVPEVAERFGRRFGVPHFTSLREATAAAMAAETIIMGEQSPRPPLLRRRRRGVWVAAPTAAHKDLILQAALAAAAAESYSAIAVEKPVCMDPKDTLECYAACAANNVALHCAFQRRADPSYQAVAREIAAGAIGTPLSVHTVFRDHPSPPIEFLVDGGDPFHDLATHDIDFILSVVGGEVPDEVFATGTSMHPELREANVVDTASITLKFRSGMAAFLDLSRNSAYGYDQRIEVFGSNGRVLAVENPSASFVIYGSEDGVARSVLPYSFPQRFEEAYKIEMDRFVDMVLGKAEPPVSAKDAAMATVVAEAALQSARCGSVVKIILGSKVESLEFEATIDGRVKRWSPVSY